MAKIIRLTESDLTKIVRRVIKEQNKIGSFDDETGWYDEYDSRINPEDFGDDYDEEEFDEFEPMYAKHGKDTRWFADDSWGAAPSGKDLFDKYRKHTGKPMKVRTRRSMEESDLSRIFRKVIMESESPSYHLFVEALDEIEEDMKKKNLTDEKLDNIRERLEDEKTGIKDSDDDLTEIEKKRLNKRTNSLIIKLKGMYDSDH